MPLVPCPECATGISDFAQTCPQCGYPVKGKGTETAEVVVTYFSHGPDENWEELMRLKDQGWVEQGRKRLDSGERDGVQFDRIRVDLYRWLR